MFMCSNEFLTLHKCFCNFSAHLRNFHSNAKLRLQKNFINLLYRKTRQIKSVFGSMQAFINCTVCMHPYFLLKENCLLCSTFFERLTQELLVNTYSSVKLLKTSVYSYVEKELSGVRQ